MAGTMALAGIKGVAADAAAPATHGSRIAFENVSVSYSGLTVLAEKASA